VPAKTKASRRIHAQHGASSDGQPLDPKGAVGFGKYGTTGTSRRSRAALSQRRPPPHPPPPPPPPPLPAVVSSRLYINQYEDSARRILEVRSGCVDKEEASCTWCAVRVSTKCHREPGPPPPGVVASAAVTVRCSICPTGSTSRPIGAVYVTVGQCPDGAESDRQQVHGMVGTGLRGRYNPLQLQADPNREPMPTGQHRPGTARSGQATTSRSACRPSAASGPKHQNASTPGRTPPETARARRGLLE